MGAIKCLVCGMILESKHRWDYKQCKCNDFVFVDGGNNYFRWGGPKDLKFIMILDDNEGNENIPAIEYVKESKR